MGCTKSKEKRQKNKKIKKQKTSESNLNKTRSNSHIEDKNTNHCLSSQKERTFSQFQLKNDINADEKKEVKQVCQNQSKPLQEQIIPQDQNQHLEENELIIECSNNNILVDEKSPNENKIKQILLSESSDSSQKQNENILSSSSQNKSIHVTQSQNKSTHLSSSQNQSIYSSQHQNESQFLSKLENQVLAQYSQTIERGQVKLENQSEKKEIHQLNVNSEQRHNELLSLSNLIDSNLETLYSVYNKDIVLVIGATGAGKSTTINYLLGKKLVQSQTHHQTKKEGQLIKSFSVDYSESEDAKISKNPNKTYTKALDVYKLQHYEDDRELLLVDTPGLLNNQESTLDIANQFGITRLLQNAKSVKILLLIGHKDLVQTEGKVKLIQEAIDQYSKLIKNYNVSQKNILIGFTHLNNDIHLEQVGIELKTIYQSIKDDFKGKEFLDLVIQNIDKKQKQYILVNPLVSKKREKLINYLFNIKEVPQNQIQYHFQYQIDQNTKKEIQQLVQNYQRDIIDIFQREEYDLLTVRLNLFSKLNQQLQLPFVKKSFKESVQGLINIDLVKSTTSFLQKTIPLEIMALLMENIIKVSNYLCWTDQMKGQYKQIKESIVSYNDFIDILSHALEQSYLQIDKAKSYSVIIQDLLKLFYIYFCSDIEETFILNEKKLNIHYSGQVNIKNIYTVNYYNLSCNLIRKRLANLLDSMNQQRQQNEFVDVNELENNLTNLQRLYESKLGDHLQINSKAIYLNQIEMWSNFILQKKEVFEIDFTEEANMIKNIETMKINYKFLVNIIGNKRLIDQHFPTFQLLLKNITVKLVKQTTSLFNNTMQQRKLQKIEHSIKCGIEIMQINEDIRIKLFDQYQSLVSYLSFIVQKHEIKFNSCLSQVKSYLLPSIENHSELGDLQKCYNLSQFMSLSKLSQSNFEDKSQIQSQSRFGNKIHIQSQFFSENQFKNNSQSQDENYPVEYEVKSENLPKLEASNNFQWKSKVQNKSKFENQSRLSSQPKIQNITESNNLSQFSINLVESKYNVQTSFKQENQSRTENYPKQESSLKISKQQQEMYKSKTEDDFDQIKKKISSMQKVLSKINMEYYQIFQFFQNSETNLKNDLEIFIKDILETTQNQINEFKNHKGILNGLFILKYCSILFKEFTNENKKYDEATFQRIITLICENIKIKVEQLNKKINSIIIPKTIDDSFRDIEEQLLILSSIYQFIQNLEKYIIQSDSNNYQTLEQLVSLISQCKNNFSSNLIKKLKNNLYDYDNYRLPIDPQREQLILDQFLKLKQFPYSYSLLGYDVYECLLEKAIQGQNIIINDINQYINDRLEFNETFNQESALLSLMQIRQAGILYLTHFYGRLESPANTLEMELRMKQKGLETRVKQMITYLNYDQIFDYMKNCDEDLEKYKSIKKCLKVKIQLLFEEIIRSIHKRSFLNDENLNIIKKDLQTLEYSIVKLSEIKFKNFNTEKYFEQLGSQFNLFVESQAKKFEKKLYEQKIQKANNSYIIVSRIVNNFSQYIKEQYIELPLSMVSQLKIHFHQIEDSIDINDKLQTISKLKELKELVSVQNTFKEDYQKLIIRLNQLIQEQTITFVDSRINKYNIFSIEAISEELRGEYQCLLVETLENYQEQYKEFFSPVIQQIKEQTQEVDQLFEQHNHSQIINLIKSSNNKIIQQKIISKFILFCDIFSDLFKNKYYKQQQSNLYFLCQISDGIDIDSYNKLKQKYQELLALNEQESIKLQISSIQGINQFFIKRDLSGIELLVQFDQLNQLISEFKIQSIKHEEFLTRIHQIFDKIQKQLKYAATKFDHKTFNSIAKQIDLIEQTRINLNDKQMNIIEILIQYLQDIKSTYNNFSCYNELNSIFNKGCWSLAKIQSDMLDAKITELSLGISTRLQMKNYSQISQQLKQIEEFSQQIQESNLGLNNRNIIKALLNNYLEKLKDAQIRKDQEKFDSNLFVLIEEVSEIEKNFKECIIQFSNWNGSEIFIKDIEKFILNQVSEINDQTFQDELDVKTFSASLINIRRIGYEVCQVHEFVLEQINLIINYKFQQFSSQFISQISFQLQKDTMGQLIIQENNRNFEGIFNQIFEESYNYQSSQEYLNNITGDKFINKEFSQQYEQYEDYYQKLLRQWQAGSLNSENIIQHIKNLFQKFTSSYQSDYINQKTIKWNTIQKQQLVIMLAHLNIFWETINCQRREITCIKLHPVIIILHFQEFFQFKFYFNIFYLSTIFFKNQIQIYSIMRLISIDTTKTSTPIENHIVQVNSGEGKSIILGITSCFFSLLGYQVDYCCSNEYLCKRNLQNFHQVFQKLEIEEMINFNTIENYLHRYIDDIRKFGLKLINNISQIDLLKKETQSQQRILLLDEIDFLFNENLIYTFYPITLKYNNQDVINIFKYIWQNRSVHIDKFKQTEVYKKLFERNPNLVQWQKIIDEQILMIYQDLNDLEEYRYKIVIPSDSTKTMIKNINESSSIRENSYKSSFSYVQEWEKKNITEDVMCENLFFIINIGDFLFSLIPQEYQFILGASGTLTYMSEFQQNLTKQIFNIQKQTNFPSIYEQSNFLFDHQQNIVVKDTKLLQHLEISSQIEQIMNDDRTVIVFFKKMQEIYDFKKEINTNCNWQILSQEIKFKDQAIVKATIMNMITFVTNSFGRDCDFVNIDQELNNSGGIHIIQTFLSQDVAEEIQIKARTSRNGQFGSYSLVLNKEDLIQQFNMSPNVKSYSQDFLNQLRQSVQIKKEKQLQERLAIISHVNNKTLNIKQQLLSRNFEINQEIFDYLIQNNLIQNRTNDKNKQYHFYNHLAGQIGIFDDQFEYDEYDNPINVGLGIDNSFNDQSILIGLFYAEEGLFEDIHNIILPCLKKKGYKTCKVITIEQEFIDCLPQFDQAWVISGYKFNSTSIVTQFQDAIESHLKKQKGLMIWADNSPYVVHANLILQRISIGEYNKQPIHIKLQGSDKGDSILKAGKFLETQQFCPHLITTGINNLHEGITVCYPQVVSSTPKDNFGQLNIIGLSSSSKPCFFVLQGTHERGRIVFDCGFTKLMRDQWNTAGTMTYVTNCYAWLYWKERFAQNNLKNDSKMI